MLQTFEEGARQTLSGNLQLQLVHGFLGCLVPEPIDVALRESPNARRSSAVIRRTFVTRRGAGCKSLKVCPACLSGTRGWHQVSVAPKEGPIKAGFLQDNMFQ